MVMDIYWISMNEDTRNYLMDLCGQNRYRVVEPEELLPGLPECLQQYSFSSKLSSSLVVNKYAPWPGGSTATVVMADIHRVDTNRRTGAIEYDQQPFLLAHHSGESTASDSGCFVNEGDWTDRTIRHLEGLEPLDILGRIGESGINNYYPGSGTIDSFEGPIEELYDTRYASTLNATLDLMRRD